MMINKKKTWFGYGVYQKDTKRPLKLWGWCFLLSGKLLPMQIINFAHLACKN